MWTSRPPVFGPYVPSLRAPIAEPFCWAIHPDQPPVILCRLVWLWPEVHYPLATVPCVRPEPPRSGEPQAGPPALLSSTPPGACVSRPGLAPGEAPGTTRGATQRGALLRSELCVATCISPGATQGDQVPSKSRTPSNLRMDALQDVCTVFMERSPFRHVGIQRQVIRSSQMYPGRH